MSDAELDHDLAVAANELANEVRSSLSIADGVEIIVVDLHDDTWATGLVEASDPEDSP